LAIFATPRATFLKKKKKVFARVGGQTTLKPNGGDQATPKPNGGGFDYPHFGPWGSRTTPKGHGGGSATPNTSLGVASHTQVAQKPPLQFYFLYFFKKMVATSALTLHLGDRCRIITPTPVRWHGQTLVLDDKIHEGTISIFSHGTSTIYNTNESRAGKK
jgi:hypothetical protein